MKVLVVGSGGREHALVWKIAQSDRVKKIYCAPGNGGIAQQAECVPIKADKIDKLLDFAKKNVIDLTVVGPEVPLVAGIVDLFNKNGLPIFGPTQGCARLEGSKIFTKELAKKCKIPTAEFTVFDTASKAKKYIESIGAPCVVKADGLAAGKGVIVAKTVDEAKKAVTTIMEEGAFGSSGERVIIENCLVGEEASIIVMTDGEHFAPLASSQDHKRIFDGDKGPNTGGMGAYSPAPVVTEEVFDKTINQIITPTIKELAAEGNKCLGVLYAGIMVTGGRPNLLEFNVRFGDPETQAILPRLDNDLTDLIELSIDGKLNHAQLQWDQRSCVCVVIASGGYPGNYEKGKLITGLNEAREMEDVVVFHAGTVRDASGNILTAGGRVLGVTALGDDLQDAINRAYQACSVIKFDNMHYRKDIGSKALIGKS